VGVAVVDGDAVEVGRWRGAAEGWWVGRRLAVGVAVGFGFDLQICE
jgi:hypothetical protein